MHPLDGPRLRLDRAAYHISTLNDFISSWENTEQFTCVGNPNAEQSSYIYTIEFTAVPGGLGIIIGDILHNLRTSLDNLAWQLALLTTSEPSNKTSFPIFSTKSDWALGKIQRIIENIPKNARDIIYSLQPYMTPNPTTHALCILCDLSNCDKHRVMTLAGQGSNIDMRAGMCERWLNDYTIEITVPMLDKQFPPPPPKIHSSCIGIAGKGNFIYRVEVTEAIHQFISSSVLPRFASFFP